MFKKRNQEEWSCFDFFYSSILKVLYNKTNIGYKQYLIKIREREVTAFGSELVLDNSI